MARHRFGGGIPDWAFTVNSAGVTSVASGVVITFWTASSGGTQYTDLADAADGSGPRSSVITAVIGTPGQIVVFYGPDGVRWMWAETAGVTGRQLLIASDLGDEFDALAASFSTLNGLAVLRTLADAKGDLIAGTGPDVLARLGVGTDGQVLTASSAAGTGLAWAAPATGNIPATIIDAKGDLIVGTAPDTAGKLTVGANGQALLADSSQAGGLRWGSATGIAAGLFVCATDANAADKARADYQCDGVGDQVEILAAIAAAKTAGHGRVLLSGGTFTLAAPIVLDGVDNVNTEIFLTLLGQGPNRTRIVCGSGIAAGIQLTKVVQAEVGRLRIEVVGATHGVQSVATNTSTAGYRSFWLSHLHDIEVIGDFSAHTGWAFHLESPFRSVLQNLEANGVGNGMRLFSSNDAFNPGDCIIQRCFMDIVGNNHTGYSIESNTANSSLNQVMFDMCEAIASGTGCTGIYVGGTGGTPGASNHNRFRGINLEKFDKLIDCQRGEGNIWECNYVQLRAAATLTAFTFGANAWNNEVRHVGEWYLAGVAQVLVNDGNTAATGQPNIVQRVKILADTGSTVTATRNSAATTIIRDVLAQGAGTATSVVRSPLVLAPNVVQTLTDAATINVDASLGNHFRVTLAGNRTLANPTNAVDGQKTLFEIIQDATGSRTITLGSKFALGSDIASVTLSTTAGKRDFLGVVYNATSDKFYVVALAKGY